MSSKDTICAIATPPGKGGVGVIRVSGTKVSAISTAMLGGVPKPRYAVHKQFKSQHGETLDDGLALFFPGPNSFTGEDVLELQGHGGPVVLDSLLQELLSLGCRMANPGEFSERAFLNDKLDLAQAEAIADLIDSSTKASAQAALRSLSGDFSKQIHDLRDELVNIRMFVESAIDFPEEEIDFLAESDVVERIEAVLAKIETFLDKTKQGQLLRDGMTVVLAGKPNAGKSSLLNALAGYDAAIVTDIAGTTRDVLKEYISIDGMPLHIIDTAGLRESADVVEQEGIRRARSAMENADRVLYLIDHNHGFSSEDQRLLEELPDHIAHTLVYNKIDQSGGNAGAHSSDAGVTQVHLSAKTGDGLADLKEHLKTIMGFHADTETQFIARRRHIDAIERCYNHIQEGLQQLQAMGAGELLAEDLLYAQNAMNEVTGEFTPDDLLGEIFSNFCIGK